MQNKGKGRNAKVKKDNSVGGKKRDWTLPKIGGRMLSYVIFVQSLSMM